MQKLHIENISYIGDLLQLFQYKKYSRAYHGIFIGGIWMANKFCAVGIGIVFTIPGTNLIDPAEIIRSQKRAGAVFYHKIPIFIKAEVGFDKDGFF